MIGFEAEIIEFQDREYRESYADEFLNSYVANQIRVLREQRGMTQQQLGESIGTQQAGISRIENVNYSGWGIRTLKRIAHALDCRLHISFETYGSLLEDGASFIREALRRPSFENDPKFRKRIVARRSSNLLQLAAPNQPMNAALSRAASGQNLQQKLPFGATFLPQRAALLQKAMDIVTEDTNAPKVAI